MTPRKRKGAQADLDSQPPRPVAKATSAKPATAKRAAKTRVSDAGAELGGDEATEVQNSLVADRPNPADDHMGEEESSLIETAIQDDDGANLDDDAGHRDDKDGGGVFVVVGTTNT